MDNSYQLFRFGLALVFIFCKLTCFIHWSWVWVLSPIWIIEIIGFFINIHFDKKMKASDKKTIYLCVLITIVLTILKSIKFINISWLWVFGFIWIPILLSIFISGLIFFLVLIKKLFEKILKESEKRKEMQDRVNRKVADEIFNGEN